MPSYGEFRPLYVFFVAVDPMEALQSVEAVAKVTQSRYDVAVK
jgi:hypothetical protein